MIKFESGQAMFLTVFTLAIVIASILMIITFSQTFFSSSSYAVNSEKVTGLAEAGLEKAIASLNSTGGSYSGEIETSLGDGSFSVEITDVNSTTKKIKAIGYYPSKANAKLKKVIEIATSKGTGTAFNYGLQAGAGGVSLSNSATINGPVYANGSILMSNGAKINGDAYVAGGTQPIADQQADCVSPSCSDYLFGKTISGENRLDVAQGFKTSSGGVLNKVAIKIKKIGSPSNVSVRVLRDDNGVPDKTRIEAQGTLSASAVTGSYNFIEVTFSSSPNLSANTNYWLMIDTSSDNTNYWSWSMDSSAGYTRGVAKYSPNWSAGSPIWNSISGDLGFMIYLGGVITEIRGGNGVIITGNAYAHNLTNLTIQKGAYYQTMSNITAQSLHPNSTDPSPISFPISDANIQEWKNLAERTHVYTGNINGCPANLSSGKYVGSISLTNNCVINVDSPIWITGTLTLSNGVTLKLTSVGAVSGAIIVDGLATLSNSNKLQGSGAPGSYLFLVGNSGTSSNPGANAIIVSNGGNTGVLYSNWGTIIVSNNNTLTSVTGWRLNLANNVIINYDQGLAGTFFSSGPSGAFSLMKGTYQLK